MAGFCFCSHAHLSDANPEQQGARFDLLPQLLNIGRGGALRRVLKLHQHALKLIKQCVSISIADALRGLAVKAVRCNKFASVAALRVEIQVLRAVSVCHFNQRHLGAVKIIAERNHQPLLRKLDVVCGFEWFRRPVCRRPPCVSPSHKSYRDQTCNGRDGPPSDGKAPTTASPSCPRLAYGESCPTPQRHNLHFRSRDQLKSKICPVLKEVNCCALPPLSGCSHRLVAPPRVRRYCSLLPSGERSSRPPRRPQNKEAPSPGEIGTSTMAAGREVEAIPMSALASTASGLCRHCPRSKPG